MIKVGIAPTDPEAVFDIRTKWAADELGRTGKINLVDLPLELKTQWTEDRNGDRFMVDIEGLPDLDVVIITRPLAGNVVDVIAILQRKGIAVVVDIDDDFRHTSPNLAGRHKIDPNINPKYNWRHFIRACGLADWVTCSTVPLLNYAQGKSTVVPNCVPSAYLNITGPTRTRSNMKVGWSGTVGAHPGDLDITYGGVAQALRGTDHEFIVVGKAEGVKSALNLDTQPEETGLSMHSRYPELVALIDVGIAPLKDSAYNRAKSHLKVLEYTALGIPWVASNLPEYVQFEGQLSFRFRYGSEVPGVVVKPRGRDWAREVAARLNWSEDQRDEATGVGKEFVRECYTIEGQADRWLEAWTRAYELRNR